MNFSDSQDVKRQR